MRSQLPADAPHLTVACLIEHQGKLLFVREKKNGRLVYNQPAGHVDHNESQIQAAEREAYEESGWRVRCTAVLGLYQYTAPNHISYHRTAFIAEAIEQDQQAQLDSDITDIQWLSPEAFFKLKPEQLRSPIVRHAVEDYLAGKHWPLSLLAPPCCGDGE